jgi:hypothetical protein
MKAYKEKEANIYKHNEPRSRLRLSGLFHTTDVPPGGSSRYPVGTRLIEPQSRSAYIRRDMSPECNATAKTTEALLISAEVCMGQNFIILLALAQPNPSPRFTFKYNVTRNQPKPDFLLSQP